MISGFSDLGKVIYEACERLGISNSEAYELRFLGLVVDALNKIGTGNSVGEKYNLYEVGNSSFADGRKLFIPHEMIDNLEVLDKEGATIDPCDYSIRGNYVLFKEVQTDPIIIKFRGLLFDIKNEPWISHNHFEAVVSYLVHMENTTRYFSKKIPRYIYIDSKEWWQDRLGEARGNDSFASNEQFEEASAILYSVKLFLESGALKVCEGESINDLLFTYMNLSDIKYGILDLVTPLVVKGDYVEDSTLSPELESTSQDMSDNFYIDITDAGYLTVVVPQSEGTIVAMVDSVGKDIFPNYFNIIKDDVRMIRIYKAVNFLNPGNYKLTFEFLKP